MSLDWQLDLRLQNWSQVNGIGILAGAFHCEEVSRAPRPCLCLSSGVLPLLCVSSPQTQHVPLDDSDDLADTLVVSHSSLLPLHCLVSVRSLQCARSSAATL